MKYMHLGGGRKKLLLRIKLFCERNYEMQEFYSTEIPATTWRANWLNIIKHYIINWAHCQQVYIRAGENVTEACCDNLFNSLKMDLCL